MFERSLLRWLSCACAVACGALVALALVSTLTTAAWGQSSRAARPATAADRQRTSEVRAGALATREGLRLQLVTDLGNVRVLSQGVGPDKEPQVSYRVQLETDSQEPGAQDLLKEFVWTARAGPVGVQLIGRVPGRSAELAGERAARLWVHIEVSVPRNYSLDVVTQAGNIETQDMDGRVTLVTSGGNITAGDVGGAKAAGALLETQGGHITVQRVNGDLRATTAGGHVNAAEVRGNVVLRSGGGHIRAGTIRGTALLETGGGNISVERAGANVTATTDGGQIDLGEAGGAIRARTGGGGIRIRQVTGPTQLETSGGSILLTQVQGTVRALTGAGSITAWFTPEGRLAGASQLESGQGDIVVYLPRELPVTIDATIEKAAEHRIEADPALPLEVTYVASGPGARAVRGKCILNGGGEILRLKTTAGNIRLRLSDADADVRLRLQQQMEQLRQRLELQQQRLVDQMRQHEWEFQWVEEQTRQRMEEHEREASRLEAWGRKIQELWLGGVRVDPETQQQKLIHSVSPVYPDLARQAGIEGPVRLRVTVGKGGTVQDLKVLSGEPWLADAAMQAVRQWRYQPTRLDGKPVNVVTTVTVVFRLR